MTDKSTCNPYYKYASPRDMCPFLKKPHIFLKHFVMAIKPPMVCPLQQRTYKVENFILPSELLRFMPKTKGAAPMYFYNRITGTMRNREILCFEFFSFVAD